MADGTRSQRLEELERQVNERVRKALSELRRQLSERLHEATDQIAGALGREMEEAGPDLPASFLSADELAPLAEESRQQARRTAFAELCQALAVIDRAGSQGQVLRALVREGRRFADRTAAFLVRDEALHLWSSAGWRTDSGDEGALGEASLPFAEDGPWSRAALGSGAAEISAAEAAPFSEQVDQDSPEGAVLVPLVLRDRLAAVIYADAAGALPLEAIQTLTYTAALALESLPFRERESTPTLVRSGTGEAAEPLDEAVAESEAAPAAREEAPSTAVAPAPAAAPEEGSPEDQPTPVVPASDFTGAPEEPGEPRDGEVAAVEEVEDVEDAGAGAWELEDGGPQAEVGELEVSEPEVPTADGDSPPFEAGGLDSDFEMEVEDDLEDDLELEDVDLEDVDLEDGFDAPEPAIEAQVEDVEEIEVEEPAVEEVPVEETTGEEAAPDRPGPAGAADSAPAPASSELPSPPGESAPPAPAPDSPPPAPPAGGSSQVAPPADLEGPGAAFAAEEQEEGEEKDGRHEEARRLARLLVSEIRLYNEEEVEEGRRNNDVYRRLKEDIDRSRQMYDERIDPSVRDGTDYFYQELVRNLGGGDAATLGI